MARLKPALRLLLQSSLDDRKYQYLDGVPASLEFERAYGLLYEVACLCWNTIGSYLSKFAWEGPRRS
jgi:hypothetical protein